jgi:hypothetical protein
LALALSDNCVEQAVAPSHICDWRSQPGTSETRNITDLGPPVVERVKKRDALLSKLSDKRNFDHACGLPLINWTDQGVLANPSRVARKFG